MLYYESSHFAQTSKFSQKFIFIRDSNQCVREGWSAEAKHLFQHSKQGTLLIVPSCEVVSMEKTSKRKMGAKFHNWISARLFHAHPIILLSVVSRLISDHYGTIVSMLMFINQTCALY
jgi:hypothetical protein